MLTNRRVAHNPAAVACLAGDMLSISVGIFSDAAADSSFMCSSRTSGSASVAVGAPAVK
ncbi:hypothetical protein APX70_03559, partial [Pseudomonas syringae pv. maculicola]